MRPKLTTVCVVGVAGFLLATNPVVADAARLITGADIKNGSVTGADIKNGTLTGADVKDKSLKGPDLLVRVARAEVLHNAVLGVTGAHTAVQTSITAPTRGFLMVTASSDVWGTGSDYPDCWITIDNVKKDASERSLQLDPTTNGEENCSTNITAPVSAGVHSVALIARPNVIGTTFDETTIQVLFVPFGPTGKLPVL